MFMDNGIQAVVKVRGSQGNAMPKSGKIVTRPDPRDREYPEYREYMIFIYIVTVIQNAPIPQEAIQNSQKSTPCACEKIEYA